MPLRGVNRHRFVVPVALGIALVVRVACLLQDPLIHPDGPAYIGLAGELLRGRAENVIGGYYSPLYPSIVAAFVAAGLPPETAGRMVAMLAGLAVLPLVHRLAGRLLGEEAAAGAVFAAALHPELVKSSVQVLPETLAGALLLSWILVLLDARGPRAIACAGALAGATYLARPEGVLLVPLGLWRVRGRRAPAVALYGAAAILVMLPALVALRARSGHWQLSPREARIAARTGVPGASSLVDATIRNPAAIIRRTAIGVVRQTAYDAKALGPLLWIPAAVGLFVAAPRGPGAWPLLVAGWFTALPLALNPSPRYAVPLVPLVLPWVGAGLVALRARLGRGATPAAVVLGVALAVQSLRLSHPLDAACSREVSALLLDRYGPGQALVAVDGRFAYGARGLALVPASTEPDDALALARRRGAGLWLTRPAWLPRGWTPPADVRPVARPCGGTFVLFRVSGS